MQDNMGREGRIKNGRTAWQRIVGSLASRRTGVPPHLTLGFGTAQDVKGVAVGEGKEKDVRNRQRKREAEESNKDSRSGIGCADREALES